MKILGGKQRSKEEDKEYKKLMERKRVKNKRETCGNMFDILIDLKDDNHDEEEQKSQERMNKQHNKKEVNRILWQCSRTLRKII